MMGAPSWYYVDSWQWVPSTWGASGSGQWKQINSKGPFYDSLWAAEFEQQVQGNYLKLVQAKHIVRRFRWHGSWIREV